MTDPAILQELDRLRGIYDLSTELTVISSDRLIQLIAGEREKFSRADPILQVRLISELIDRRVYHTSWNGLSINVMERVQCWGAEWHLYSEPHRCPACGIDLCSPLGPPFKREISLYSRVEDRTTAYQCPDCKARWEQ